MIILLSGICSLATVYNTLTATVTGWAFLLSLYLAMLFPISLPGLTLTIERAFIIDTLYISLLVLVPYKYFNVLYNLCIEDTCSSPILILECIIQPLY